MIIMTFANGHVSAVLLKQREMTSNFLLMINVSKRGSLSASIFGIMSTDNLQEETKTCSLFLLPVFNL